MKGPHARMETAASSRWDFCIGRAVKQREGLGGRCQVMAFPMWGSNRCFVLRIRGEYKSMESLYLGAGESLNQLTILWVCFTPFANHKAAFEPRGQHMRTCAHIMSSHTAFKESTQPATAHGTIIRGEEGIR